MPTHKIIADGLQFPEGPVIDRDGSLLVVEIERRTVTRVATESYGGMADEDGTAQIEIRASWTPVGTASGDLDLRPHTEAWGELLCTAAGLPPVPEGVTVMPSRRGQRGA